MDSDGGWFKWTEEARSVQNHMCKVLGNRLYDEIDESNLKNKVSFAIFGAPSSGYNEEQSKLIDEITDKIISLSGELVYINFVFVLIKLQEDQKERMEVVIRLGVKKDGILQPPTYLDLALRVYKDWKHYLETNKLPKCYMCYPVDGVYEKDEKEIVKLDFGKSHACDGVSSILNAADYTSTAGGLIGMGIAGAALCTPIGLPIAIGGLATSAVSGVYNVGRNLAKLSDMHAHDCSIGLSSSEARMAWFGVLASAASVASVGSSVVLKTVQKVGVEGAADLLRLMKILNVSSLCINGASVVIGIYNIVLKCFSGNLESKDVFTFVLSCAFMFNAVISTTMAERMIEEISQKHMDTLGNVISMVSCTVGPAIHVANEYENYKRLLYLIVGFAAQFADSIDLHKIECSILNIRHQIMALVRLETDLKTFVSKISVDLQALWECYERVCKLISNAIYNITYNPKFYLKNKNGQMVPRPLNIGIMYDLNKKVRSTAENLSLKQSEEEIKKREVRIMRLARDFDELEPAENLSEFFFKVNFFCNRLVEKHQVLKDAYDNKLDVAMMAKDFNERIFNSENGIRSENLNNHFFLETVTPDAKDFKYWYTIYNELEKGPFKDNYFQDFEYESVFPFCCPPNGSNLTEDDYFSYATEFSGMKIDGTTSKMFTDGRLVVLNPLPKQPVPRVLFYNPENTEETSQQNCPVGIAVVQKQRFFQTAT